MEGRDGVETDTGGSRARDEGRQIARPHVVQPHHQMHARVLAGDLYTIPEVLAQRADQRVAPRGVPIPGASQVALELAGRDEVGERLLRERGREAVSRPLGGDEGGHERAGQHEVRDPQRREERL